MGNANKMPASWRLRNNAAHPWVVEGDSNWPGISAKICEVSYRPYARLIAVAPKLYAIARSVAKLELHKMPDGKPCNCTMCGLAREAQSVISKVERG